MQEGQTTSVRRVEVVIHVCTTWYGYNYMYLMIKRFSCTGILPHVARSIHLYGLWVSINRLMRLQRDGALNLEALKWRPVGMFYSKFVLRSIWATISSALQRDRSWRCDGLYFLCCVFLARRAAQFSRISSLLAMGDQACASIRQPMNMCMCVLVCTQLYIVMLLCTLRLVCMYACWCQSMCLNVQMCVLCLSVKARLPSDLYVSFI